MKIWDLRSKSIVDELHPKIPPVGKSLPFCTSLQWSADSGTLFTGFTDYMIRVYGPSTAPSAPPAAG